MNPLRSLPSEIEWSFYGTNRFRRYRILSVDLANGEFGSLVDSLGDAGFQVISAMNADSALVKARASMPSLIFLGLGSRRSLGMEVLRQLKAEKSTSHIPIILLAAKSTAEERIEGLELRADDSITLPVSPRELAARVRNSLKRAEPGMPEDVKMTLDDLVLDPVRHEVAIHHQPVYLSLNEFRLLNLFMERCGDVLDRDTLLSEVWGQVSCTITRTVDTHVKRLRKRLGPWARHLESIRGVGYRLSESVSSGVREPEFVQAKRNPAPHFAARQDKGKSLFRGTKRSRFDLPKLDSAVLVSAGKI